MMSKLAVTILADDLSGTAIRELIARHLRGMREHSPPESVHALDVERLKDSTVTFWSAWIDGSIAGCGALKRLDATRGEIKSMRVEESFLGQGVGRAILEHVLEHARMVGLKSLWLETGSSHSFVPALKLYESAGFTRCGPFDDYFDDPFSIFMTRML